MSISSRHSITVETAQAGVFLAVSTLALSVSLLGILGLVTGSVLGLDTRLPFYVLVMATTFVAGVVVLESEFRDGMRALGLSATGAALTLLFVTLAGEGTAFLVQRPQQVVGTNLLFYVLAAGLVGTGLGYWALQQYDDIPTTTSEL